MLFSMPRIIQYSYNFFCSRTPKPKLWIFSSRTPNPKLLITKLEGTGTNPQPRIRPLLGEYHCSPTCGELGEYHCSPTCGELGNIPPPYLSRFWALCLWNKTKTWTQQAVFLITINTVDYILLKITNIIL